MGVHVGWCRRRTSNPVCPAYGGIGGFDSHTLPPSIYYSATQTQQKEKNNFLDMMIEIYMNKSIKEKENKIVLSS